MSDRLTLPVLPLREVVLFPGVTAPIGAGRPATLRAIEAALATPERLVFAVSQRQNVESVSSDVLYTIGTIARIGQLQRGLSGMQLLLHGERRGIAIHYSDREGYLQAVVREAEEMLPLNAEDPAFVALHREARVRAAELGQKSGLPDEVVQQVLAGVDTHEWLDKVFFYQLVDEPDSADEWGILRADLSPKLAYEAYQHHIAAQGSTAALSRDMARILPMFTECRACGWLRPRHWAEDD